MHIQREGGTRRRLNALAASSIDESRDPDAGRLDIAGILLFGGGLFSTVWGLIDGNGAGWHSLATLLKLGIGTFLLGLFVLAERFQRRAMVDLTLFRDRTVVGAAVAMLGYAATAQVMMTILPLYLQDAFGQLRDQSTRCASLPDHPDVPFERRTRRGSLRG